MMCDTVWIAPQSHIRCLSNHICCALHCGGPENDSAATTDAGGIETRKLDCGVATKV